MFVEHPPILFVQVQAHICVECHRHGSCGFLKTLRLAVTDDRVVRADISVT